jgi:hypothetical protein
VWPDNAKMALHSQDDERDQFRKLRWSRPLKANILHFADEACWFLAKNKNPAADHSFRD